MSSTVVASGALNKTPVSTPKKEAEAPLADSPGNWSHPRLAEITRRREATRFSDKNVRIIAYNSVAIGLVLAFRFSTWVQRQTQRFSETTRGYIAWAYFLVLLILLGNIGAAFLPLVRQPDDLSDIPLTPAQRKLLGLGPSSRPPTPGSVYSTPPRYNRTPSISGSVGSNRSWATSSPLSNKGSGSPAPQTANRLSGSPFSPIGGSGIPFLQKAMNGGTRRSSFGSQPSPLNGGTSSSGNSLFVDVTATGTPSPLNKRTSVGLNNKWLYEKGRRTSGSAWLH